jgi:hypothetical protein
MSKALPLPHSAASLAAIAQELAMESKGAHTGSYTVRFADGTTVCVSHSLYSGATTFLVRGAECSPEYAQATLDACQHRGRRG